MIIVNERLRGQTVKFGKERVSFDKLGKAKVEDAFGESLILNHPDYYEEGKKPVKVVEEKQKPEIKDEAVKTLIAELESKLLISSQKLEKAIADLSLAKEEVESWKAEYNKAKEATLLNANEGGNETPVQLQENDINIVVELCEKKKGELVVLCEGLSLPESEWKTLSAKELIVYVAKKTLSGSKTE